MITFFSISHQIRSITKIYTRKYENIIDFLSKVGGY